MERMASKETRAIPDRLDNKDLRECVVLLDLRVSQAKKVPVVLKAPKVTKATLDILVFKEFQELLDPKDALVQQDLKVLLDPKDLPVSLVLMDLPVQLVPPV